MNQFADTFLLVFAALFPLVNPIGGAPIFLSLTRHCTAVERAVLARRISVNGFLLLLGSLFVGARVLEFFGITLPIVRIAGGLVVTAFGWRLLHTGEEPDETPGVGDRPVGPDDAFYPLTMPLTVGPGSIAVAITLGAHWTDTASGISEVTLLAASALAGLAAIGGAIYVCYRFAERLTMVLGESGTGVVIRLSAFILLCIGIQIVWNGYLSLMPLAEAVP